MQSMAAHNQKEIEERFNNLEIACAVSRLFYNFILFSFEYLL
jgi:hypothetical protein